MEVSIKLTWCAVAALGLGLASCNRDNGSLDDATKGKESMVKLVIYDQRPTRGTADTEAATGDESDVTGNVKVIVFHSDGTFDKETALTLTGSGPYETSHFPLEAGAKYIYTFFNDDAREDIPSGSGKTRVQFEQSAFGVDFDASTSLPDIAANKKFLIGTSYGATEIVAGGGTAAEPVKIALSVGRAASKLNLKEVKDKTGAGMKGTFSDYSYRVGSVAKKLYVVGQYATTDVASVPPAAGGKWTAFSAVHDEPSETTPGVYNAAAFLQYSVWKAPGAAFYITENTTKEDALGYLYFGNTTYVQLKSKYAPAASEILDPESLASGQALAAGGDFWTVQLKDGTRVIVNKDPSDAVLTLHANIDRSQPFRAYAGGYNYHKFAVYDDDPSLVSAVQKNAVLRNTYYEYNVTDLTTLGSWSETVAPSEPVPTATEVELKVTIKPWFKIADDIVL
ncbi:MAG: fimbria major subunit [Odoribacteraceae bacterium]|nr:fimbria major subunit [Odoribacteraceae bacterium]